jgi:hypothetical protein
MIQRSRARTLPGHLVRRYWWAITARPLGPAAQSLVRVHLLPAEQELFFGMDVADQRHHVQVTRRFLDRVGSDVPHSWAAGALLHDVGKSVCGFGTPGRVLATLSPFGRRGDSRIGRYYRHEAIGASLLLAAGSHPDTVALVGHWPEAPERAAAALAWADDL